MEETRFSIVQSHQVFLANQQPSIPVCYTVCEIRVADVHSVYEVVVPTLEPGISGGVCTDRDTVDTRGGYGGGDVNVKLLDAEVHPRWGCPRDTKITGILD